MPRVCAHRPPHQLDLLAPGALSDIRDTHGAPPTRRLRGSRPKVVSRRVLPVPDGSTGPAPAHDGQVHPTHCRATGDQSHPGHASQAQSGRLPPSIRPPRWHPSRLVTTAPKSGHGCHPHAIGLPHHPGTTWPCRMPHAVPSDRPTNRRGPTPHRAPRGVLRPPQDMLPTRATFRQAWSRQAGQAPAIPGVPMSTPAPDVPNGG